MAEVQTIAERSSEKLRGRDRRSLNLSTKLTAAEAKAIEEAATGRAGHALGLIRRPQGHGGAAAGTRLAVLSMGADP